MPEVVPDTRREIVRDILTQAQLEVDLALKGLDDYDMEHFLEIERSAGGLINFFPANARNTGCY